MNEDEAEEILIWKAVVNHEEQYSIWPEGRENPPGWKDTGIKGPKSECLAYISKVWTDMRPLSLRKKMEGSVGEGFLGKKSSNSDRSESPKVKI